MRKANPATPIMVTPGLLDRLGQIENTTKGGSRP